MPTKLKKSHVWNLASVGLQDSFTDFILSRQAMNCTPATLQFYRFTAGVFVPGIDSQGLMDPQEVTRGMFGNT